MKNFLLAIHYSSLPLISKKMHPGKNSLMQVTQFIFFKKTFCYLNLNLVTSTSSSELVSHSKQTLVYALDCSSLTKLYVQGHH